MKDISLSRRAVMLGVAALPMAQQAVAQARPKPVVVIQRQRIQWRRELLRQGHGFDQGRQRHAGCRDRRREYRRTGSARYRAWGTAGFPMKTAWWNSMPVAFTDPRGAGGAVGALRGIKTPSKIAQLVMAETDHMMLVGEGALQFAKAYGYQEEDLLTDRSRLAWRMWKREMRDRNGHSNWESQHRCSAQEEDRRIEEGVSRAWTRIRSRGRTGVAAAPAARHHQLHCAERKGRDVGGDHDQRDGLEDRRPVRRFADHRRRSVAGPGRRRAPDPRAAAKRICGFAARTRSWRTCGTGCRRRMPFWTR